MALASMLLLGGAQPVRVHAENNTANVIELKFGLSKPECLRKGF